MLPRTHTTEVENIRSRRNKEVLVNSRTIISMRIDGTKTVLVNPRYIFSLATLILRNHRQLRIIHSIRRFSILCSRRALEPTKTLGCKHRWPRPHVSLATCPLHLNTSYRDRELPRELYVDDFRLTKNSPTLYRCTLPRGLVPPTAS